MRKLKIRNPLADKSPEDRTVMAICLGFAFVFWLLVKFSEEYTVVRTVELAFELPSSKAFATPPPTSVFVNLTGQGWYFLVAGITGKRYALTYAVPDNSSFNLTPTMIRSDLDDLIGDNKVRFTNLLFDGARYTLEDRDQVLLPVRLQYDLAFADEYHLADSIVLKPDSVLITGPGTQLAPLTFWLTDSLIINELDKDFKGEVSLKPAVDGIHIAPEKIQVEIPVERYTEKEIFVTVEVLNPPADSIKLFPDKALIKCVIGLSYYNDLNADSFRLVADLSKTFVREGKNTVALELIHRPDYVHSALVNPRSTEFFVIEAAGDE